MSGKETIIERGLKRSDDLSKGFHIVGAQSGDIIFYDPGKKNGYSEGNQHKKKTIEPFLPL